MEHSSTRPHEIGRPQPKLPLWNINRLLLALIDLYQRRISPRKGWRCAYSVMHGGPGCSGYAREAIETYGWQAAKPLIRQRFRDCKTAARESRSRRQIAAFSPEGSPFDPASDPGQGPIPGPTPPPGQGRRRNKEDCSDCGNCPPDLPFCDSPSDARACSFLSFDAFDIGSCHFGGCDGCSCDGCDSCSCDGCGN